MVSDVKVAFCISGEPRMYKKCYSRFRKHINLLKNEAMEKHGCKVTVDIFIHSWDRTSTYRNNDPAFTKKEKRDPKQHIQYDIKELRDELINDFYHMAPTLAGVEINHQREKRLRGLGGTVSGQFDGLVVDGKRALIYDFKFGYLDPIDATHNLQMRCLAVLVAENYESVNEINDEPMIAERMFGRVTNQKV